jgi:hypothetical protein
MLGSWFEHSIKREQIKNIIARSTSKSAILGQLCIRLNLLQKAAGGPADLNVTR